MSDRPPPPSRSATTQVMVVVGILVVLGVMASVVFGLLNPPRVATALPTPSKVSSTPAGLTVDQQAARQVASGMEGPQAFSTASFAYWNANSYVWSAALSEEDGAVSGMSFRVGFAKGLHSCS